MKRTYSAELNADVIEAMERAAARLSVPSDEFVEQAIQAWTRRAEALEPTAPPRVETDGSLESFMRALNAASGSWKRDESPEETIRNARAAFRLRTHDEILADSEGS